MKSKILLFLIVTITVTSCDDADEIPLSPIPEIEFQKIEFNHGDGSIRFDTLSILLSFKDGDSDLGLHYDSNEEPFHIFNYYTSHGERMTVLDTAKFNYLKLGDNDTLPDFPSCKYEVYNQDTIYRQFNRFHNNLHVDIYTESNGRYEKFDFEEIGSCGGLSIRFPRIDQKGRIIKGHWIVINSNKYEGTIEYKIASPAWYDRFEESRLKFKLRINDRALNMSNWIETPSFTLNELANN